MVDTSAGKKLSTARVNQGLSLEEAAHAVKMRPDKLQALELDDYGRFGSPAYAKGFLMIYSRFLGVDVSDQLRDFEGMDTRVNIAEYQYLSNVQEPKPDPHISSRRMERRGTPSVLPLLVFVTLLVVAGFGYWVFIGMQRLGLDKSGATAAPAVAATPVVVEPAPKAAPATPRKRIVTEKAVPSAIAATEVPAVENVVPAIPDAPPAAREVSELLIVEPVRTTMVKIRRDSPDSAPIYEGYLYPGFGPLKARGTRFFVEAADQSAIKISKGGRHIAAYQPGIAIQ